ncbi:hypothetical protein OFR22_06515 [Brachyspira hyodysenteriae]|uniref:hypothetical protein n=1 Tax=Brachyspira hyodysenteriae TaxID=159 RepID=UPI0022CDAF38|nr:hypothetical protein [Brachyspira hyodysenteriae]MCZ9838942.1 hypothetical protein [Brachyspira hyodysenteriae]MCZ9847561.1 hypothetical protein [Brachyspira hyodysenteriae]MCZ9871057.1 hypothetical protein [Brachyspira hyodysenteriae]MCZ9872287.1 hypothetical protein [Brachyspira hyodysenteriae]MCZ9876488.1 hypothetical protein [Brachyspira hyodysenteriae]
MKIKKKKNESNHNVIGLIIYLFLSLIIPSTAISFFAMADKNIKEKKEIIDNNKQTNAANFDKEEILQKIITSLLLKGSSSSKYSGSKVDLKILGIRVLIVYGLTYILSLAITAIIAQKYYHEDIKIKEDIKETIETILVGLATLALMAFVLIVTVINMESNREYLAFSGVIFGFIACIIIRKIT